MAFDEGLAERIRDVLRDEPQVEEKHMFGGIAFMVRGHMTVGIVGEDLMVRLGEEGAAAALAEPHVRAMDFTGKPMRTMAYVAPDGFEDDEDLEAWVSRALAFNATLDAR